MASKNDLLLDLLRKPTHAAQLTEAEWDLAIRQARKAGLSAKLQQVLASAHCMEHVPEHPRHHLDTALFVANRHGEALRWELGRILEAVHEADSPVVLLKGAAYVAAGLPVATGRTFSDVDILVPREKIEAVESALMQHGWAPMKLNAYDQRYYRQWMHEIPPLEHVRRQSVIDVHHNILPLTARHHPDAALLLADSRPSSLDPRARVLAPCDMVLHCATHLFHEGETARALRDLIDFDGLLRHFGADAAFWETLVPRAQALDLTRPLYYGLRYATRVLGTPVPEAVQRAADVGKPVATVRFTMDWLAGQGFRPDHASCADALTPLAHFLVYLRGHWLRMPPRLLLPHLLHKAFPRPEK
jgi:hypothetical protein